MQSDIIFYEINFCQYFTTWARFYEKNEDKFECIFLNKFYIFELHRYAQKNRNNKKINLKKCRLNLQGAIGYNFL